MDVEIDGFFLAEKEFTLEDYKAEEYDDCGKKIDKIIKPGTNVIYEIKSG